MNALDTRLCEFTDFLLCPGCHGRENMVQGGVQAPRFGRYAAVSRSTNAVSRNRLAVSTDTRRE